MVSTRVANPTGQRKSAADVSWRARLVGVGAAVALTASLGLAALTPVAAPAMAGLARMGQSAPIVAHALPFPNCPGGMADC